MMRWVSSVVSQPGCGATSTCSTSWPGCGRTTTCRRHRAKSVSTDWTCTACTARFAPCSPISIRSMPTRPPALATRYACFEQFGKDTQAYGHAASFDLTESCEREVVEQLLELQRKAVDYARRDGRVAEDELFFAEQNARLIKNAER